jgi:dUTP pyrophosphatase
MIYENCPVCERQFKIKSSHKKRYKGPFTCSRECRGQLLKNVYRGDKNPNFKYMDSIKKFFSIRTRDVQRRALKKDVPFNLTSDFLYDLYQKQNGLCSYTGIPMKISSTNWNSNGQADLDTLSIDRIIPEKGYTKDNVVLCCSAVNKLKGSSDVSELNAFVQHIGLKSFGTCSLKVKKLSATAQMPHRAKLGDGGYDLCADRVEETETQIKVYTGIACEPSFGWVLFALPRSSICKRGVFLTNSVGLIDNQYRGEIIAVFEKVRPDAKINVGDKIIQLMPIKTAFISVEEVNDLTETDRGTGGFGSSGQ